MPYNGSGTFTPAASPGYPAITGTTITAAQFNSVVADIATGLTNALTRDGQSAPSPNDLPMGGLKHTAVGDATARNQYASLAQVQDNAATTLASVAGTNTITAVAPFSMPAYATGQEFSFVAAGANTGAVTLNVNTLGAKAVKKQGTAALVSGNIASGMLCHVVYDGTNFQLLNPIENKTVYTFGAVGNGIADDTPAIQAAVTDAMLNGTTLHIPAGIYKLTAAITGSGTKAIGLIGEGPALTQLVWTSTASGIQLTFADSFAAGDSLVTGIGFYADTTGCVGPALQLTATTNSTLTPTFGPVITNNVIQYTKGTSATGRYWNAGIVIENFHAGLIQANFIYGRANTPAGNGLIFNGNCTPGPTISDNHFYWWNKAVTKGNTASDTVEGGYASNNILVANNYGFYWDCSGIGGDPDFKVLGGHISSLLGGVVCIDANQSWISNVLFYRRSDATGDYADITYTDSVSVHISGNTFVNSGASGTETGIDLNNVDAILCHDNFFQGSSRAVGINIDANCSRVSVYDNQYYSTTTPVINALTDLTLYNLKSINAPGYASVRLTTQPIPTSGVAAVLEWAPATLLATVDGAFAAGAPTQMVVPADITKVRVSCSVLFASNATGYRQVRILKNGTDFHGFTTDRAIALTGVGTFISSTTGLLTVTPGDYFTIEVTQTSGGALDVSSGNGTWFAMEFVG